MLYNFEVWRDVRKRLQESPPGCSSPKLLSSKELLARRRPYKWVFGPQEDRVLEKSNQSRESQVSSRHQSLASSYRAMSSQALSHHMSEDLVHQRQEAEVSSRVTTEVESRVASIGSGRAASAASLDRISSERVSTDQESRRDSYGGSQRDSRQSAVPSRDDVLFFEKICVSPVKLKSPDLSERGTPSKQLIHSGRSTLHVPSTPSSTPSGTPAVERKPMDPQVLRAMARKHRMVFPEVDKFWAIFDQLDLKGTGFIGRHEFEKLLYDCTMSPKKVRLPKHQLKELWQFANPDERNQIDFEGFLIFYRKHVDKLLGALQY
mmetsp:Transcript_5218/g.12268  ORF Transcript_5218/g.12268 Transcript_5218/m.12268 type:complete len:320 (+) Transcript_5218:84-1043(+)|eukprot:CAMPEP_0171108884 /NCGR_PEP_ID=MMETSP0766_2-20121228/69795_1 /TAXON_ID=439317 /ORGANISM="Gambierdiscus australes, Strain CAWD 149" /LENGTH=319 /DNA_ID=CAMNT_0011570501 /DNA_START=84 /DNA_END=1043 /DNA_ORIENTATION=+